MLGPLRKNPEHVAALERVKGWTVERFGLTAADVVLVREVARGYPGCVPLETVVGFWTEGPAHHHFTIFKPVCEVVEDDLPPSWLKAALLASEEYKCSCC